MQPYKEGKPFGELELVYFDELSTKVQDAFERGADEVRLIGYIDNGKTPVYDNRAGRRALKFKNKKKRK